MNRQAIAKKIIEGLVYDISDRSGIGNEFDGIDEDIKKEMLEEWEVIILNAIDTNGVKNGTL